MKITQKSGIADTSGGYDPRRQEVMDNPHVFYDMWHASSPVVYANSIDRYLVARDTDIREACMRNDVFSNATGTDKGLGEDAGALVSADEPLHTKQRNLVNLAFSPKRVQDSSLLGSAYTPVSGPISPALKRASRSADSMNVYRA